MKILATGKSGTLGRFLPEDIFGIDFRNETLNSELMKVAGEEQFSIIHLAGVVGESRVLRNLEESRHVNLVKTIQLAEYCVERSLQRFFYISTSHVYSKSNRPISELTQLDPLSEYSRQKLETEIQLTKIFQSFPEKLCILRVFSVLSYETKEYSLGAAIREAVLRSDFKIFNVDDERDFLHPYQIIQIILELIHIKDLPRVVNVCSGQAISVREGIQQVVRHKGLNIDPEQLIPGKSENPKIIGDSTLLNSILRHRPLGYKCFD